jgi:spermidine synthase
MSESSAALDEHDESESLSRHAAFVYRTPEMLSLHFDFSIIQSEMRCAAPEELVLGYTRTMMGFLLFKPNPARIAMIGLGGGSVAKYCYAKLPDTSIAVAEINPGVIALRDEFCVPRDDERFQVICQDGADFVHNSRSPFDVLIVDGYGPSGPAPQLCTQAFYDACFGALAAGGVMVVNLAGSHALHQASVARIRTSFGAAVVVESEDAWNRIAFASKGDALSRPDEQLSVAPDQLEVHHAVDLYRTLRCIRDELAAATKPAMEAGVGVSGSDLQVMS